MTIAPSFLVACTLLLGQDPAHELVDGAVRRFDVVHEEAKKLVLDALEHARETHDPVQRVRAEAELAAFLSTGELPSLAADVASRFERLRRDAFLGAASAFDRAIDALRAAGRSNEATELEAERAAFGAENDDCLWSDLLARIRPELGLDLLNGSWTRDGRDLISDASLCSTLRLPVPEDRDDYELELVVTRRCGGGGLELIAPVGDGVGRWRIADTSSDDRGDAQPRLAPVLDSSESILLTVTKGRALLESNGRPLRECDGTSSPEPCGPPGRPDVRARLTSTVGDRWVLTRARLCVSAKTVRTQKPARRAEVTERSAPPKPAEPPRPPETEPATEPALTDLSWCGDFRDQSNRWIRVVRRDGDVIEFEIEGDYPGERFRVTGMLNGKRVIVDRIECVGHARGHASAGMERPDGTITFCADGRLRVHLKAKMRRKKVTLWSLDCDDAKPR